MRAIFGHAWREREVKLKAVWAGVVGANRAGVVVHQKQHKGGICTRPGRETWHHVIKQRYKQCLTVSHPSTQQAKPCLRQKEYFSSAVQKTLTFFPLASRRYLQFVWSKWPSNPQRIHKKTFECALKQWVCTQHPSTVNSAVVSMASIPTT